MSKLWKESPHGDGVAYHRYVGPMFLWVTPEKMGLPWSTMCIHTDGSQQVALHISYHDTPEEAKAKADEWVKSFYYAMTPDVESLPEGWFDCATVLPAMRCNWVEVEYLDGTTEQGRVVQQMSYVPHAPGGVYFYPKGQHHVGEPLSTINRWRYAEEPK